MFSLTTQPVSKLEMLCCFSTSFTLNAFSPRLSKVLCDIQSLSVSRRQRSLVDCTTKALYLFSNFLQRDYHSCAALQFVNRVGIEENQTAGAAKDLLFDTRADVALPYFCHSFMVA